MAEEKEEKKKELDPQVAAVKAYLDGQCERDNALRDAYIPDKIEDCFGYIKEQARKQAVGGCAMVEDAVVYKWARDYYLEKLPEEGRKKEESGYAVASEVSDETETECDNKETEVRNVVIEKDDDSKPVRQLTLFDM